MLNRRQCADNIELSSGWNLVLQILHSGMYDGSLPKSFDAAAEEIHV